MGLRGVAIDDAQQVFLPSTGGTPLSIIDLIRFGARWEDDLSALQALRHFYDPVNDRALDLPDIGTTLTIKSPDWALEDLGDFSGSVIADQQFSYKDARTYFYNALTDPSEAQRKKFFGLTFQTLGHVIHHLQDMAQPQHVRNDAHCDSVVCSAVALYTGNRLFYAPSLYERYTNLDDASNPLNRIRSRLPYSGPGSAAVYPGDNAATVPFQSPRKLWRSTDPGSDIAAGKGIAEYTNRNFFSAGTTYRTDALGFATLAAPPQLLDALHAESSDARDLLPGTNLRGIVYFYKSSVTDALSGQTDINYRAASQSVFAPELLGPLYSTQAAGLAYSLNRFTFDAAHQFLIPRAVGYSAGLINYFFRGELEISPPDEGLYGVIDHTIENRRDVSGFRRIRLKLRNVTPGGVNENGQRLVEAIPAASAGTLVAVVKFHRNNCYQPDLSGEYGATGMNWRFCRSPIEDALASQPKPVPAGINDDATSIAFDFPNPIPINATDLQLQVVYRGPLGSEPDAVAVATRDISEPTYIYQYSSWDQYLYAGFPSVDNGPNTFQQWCAQGYPTYDECRSAMGLTWKLRFSATPGYTENPAVPELTWYPLSAERPFSPVFTIIAPVGTYGRVAILADIEAPPIVLVQEAIDATHGSAIFNWIHETLVYTRNQFDAATNGLIPSTTYVAGRGIFVQTADGFLLNSGTAPNIPPLVPVASQINF